MLGFLGGASWAILVAKVCQMFEQKVSSVVELIYCFFITFATWEWPKPVYLKTVEVAPYPGRRLLLLSADQDDHMYFP